MPYTLVTVLCPENAPEGVLSTFHSFARTQALNTTAGVLQINTAAWLFDNAKAEEALRLLFDTAKECRVQLLTVSFSYGIPLSLDRMSDAAASKVRAFLA